MSIRDALRDLDAGAAGTVNRYRRHGLGIEDDNHIGTVWLAAPIVGQVADAASTFIVIHRSDGWAREGNPVMAGLVHGGIAKQAAFVGLKLGVGAGMAYGAALLAREGHKTSAKVFSVIGSAMGVGAAVHNVSLLGKR